MEVRKHSEQGKRGCLLQVMHLAVSINPFQAFSGDQGFIQALTDLRSPEVKTQS